MVQSVCNFKRNALEMRRTSIANVIVKLNLKGRIGKRRGGGVGDILYIYIYIYEISKRKKKRRNNRKQGEEIKLSPFT